MQLLLRIVLGYFLAMALIVTLFRDRPAALLGDVARSVPGSVHLFLEVAWWALPVVGVSALFVPRDELAKRFSRAAVAVFAVTAFFLTYTVLKATMPFIVPFWADPMFAQLDRVLHFGHDPWVLAHRLAPWIDAELMGRVYFSWWAAPAMFLPVFLFLFDGDAGRIRRFIWLYAFVWIGLGNVLALAFLSAGPVFYDRIFGGEVFSGLSAALGRTGTAGGYMGALQEKLWMAYASGTQEAGSGISAFPSVHLGMVTVLGLYVAERWRWIAPASVAVIALYQFLSVFFGWHYAVDGYASIALVVVLWGVLRWRAPARMYLAQPAE